MGKKIQVELSKKDQNILKDLQNTTGGTAAAVVREALAAYKVVANETGNGGEIFAKKGDAKTKLVFPGLPSPGITFTSASRLGPHRAFWKKATLTIEDAGISRQSVEILQKELRGFRLGEFFFRKANHQEPRLELLFSFDPQDPGRIRNIFKREWTQKGILILRTPVKSGIETLETPCAKPLTLIAWDAVPYTWRIEGHVFGDLFLSVSLHGNCRVTKEKV